MDMNQVEELPEYPGGMDELMKFMQTNIRYPKEAQERGPKATKLATKVFTHTAKATSRFWVPLLPNSWPV